MTKHELLVIRFVLQKQSCSIRTDIHLTYPNRGLFFFLDSSWVFYISNYLCTFLFPTVLLFLVIYPMKSLKRKKIHRKCRSDVNKSHPHFEGGGSLNSQFTLIYNYHLEPFDKRSLWDLFACENYDNKQGFLSVVYLPFLDFPR